jgi:hypothetical protein
VLREAHMTRFSKMFAAVSGAVALGLFGISALVTSPASTQASAYEVAQINPDQITRNAPRDLPFLRTEVPDAHRGARRSPPLGAHK